jgi:hypothetical protein
MALTWRIREWNFSGGWTATGMYLGNPAVGVSTVNNTPDVQYMAIRTGYPPQASFANVHETSREIDLISEMHQPPDPSIHTLKYSSDGAGGLGWPLKDFGFVAPPATSNPIDYLKIKMDNSVSIGGAPDVYVGDAFITMLVDYRGFFPYVATLGDSSRPLDIVKFDDTAKTFAPLIAIQTGMGFAGLAIFSLTVDYDTLAALSNGVLTIDPVIADPFTVPIVIQGENTATVSSVTCDLTMTATKFFRYKNSLGQEIYNETTGALENDPFA